MIADPEVVVVGAGYVGSAAAVELGLRGIRTLVIEQDAEIPAWHPRSVQIEARTMEHFRRWGIADGIRRVNPLPPGFDRYCGFGTSLTGSSITTVPLWLSTGGADGDIASEDGAWLPQFLTERLLQERAGSLPSVEIRRGWRVGDLAQDGSGVDLEIESIDSARRRSLRARYVVGADGAGSVVRTRSGLVYEGQGDIAHWLYVPFRAPTLMDAQLCSRAVMYFLVAGGGLTVVRPLDLEHWDTQLVNVAPDSVSRSDLAALIRRAIGRDDIPFEIGETAPIRLQDLLADRWRAGRAFLVGNAAHLITHAGGHNGNTGVSDAVNIGWKLAAVLRGWGGDRLLDSYEPERRPIAAQVRATALAGMQHTAVAMQEIVREGAFEGSGPEQEASRERLVAAVHTHAQRTWEANGVSLDQRYTDSPVIVGNGTVAPAWDPRVLSPVVAPGHRAPHVCEGPDESIHDQFGEGLTLLALDGAHVADASLAAAAAARGVPLTTLRRTGRRYREAYGTSLTLIRPDGHIAWAGDGPPADPQQVIDTVSGWI